MNHIVLAHRFIIPQQVDWGGFILSAVAVLTAGIIGLVWHHRSPATTKRTPRFYFFLLLSCFSSAAILLSLTYKQIYGPSIEETYHQLASKSPDYLKEVLASMVILSQESRTYRKEKIILGTEKKEIPEALNKLGIHSIHLKKGMVQVLITKLGHESLSLKLGHRGDTYYILLNYKNDRNYKDLNRELYPHSRISRTRQHMQYRPTPASFTSTPAKPPNIKFNTNRSRHRMALAFSEKRRIDVLALKR